ncbi:MAG TPA: DUF6174 domain-containing protein [Anaerolineales bacterium]|nr:DUF6174 domain-containing protein [Anaerolineales bacterium]
MKKVFLSLALFAILLSACSPLMNSEFSKNHDKWQVENISHYRFQLFVSCFCAFVEKMPMTIEVKDGQVVSMTYKDGTAVSDQEREYFKQYDTINGLFDYTKDSISKADDIHIEYDSTYGYPANVQIDFIKQAADDELYLTVQGFEPLN